MATLLSFFKKIPRKIPENGCSGNSVEVGSPDTVKSKCPEEVILNHSSMEATDSRVLDDNFAPARRHAGEDVIAGNDASCNDLNRKRTLVSSEEGSDQDEVPARRSNKQKTRRRTISRFIKPAQKKRRTMLDSDTGEESIESGDEYKPLQESSSDDNDSSGVEEEESDQCEEEGEKIEHDKVQASKKRRQTKGGRRNGPPSKVPRTPSASSESTPSTPRMLTPALTSKLANSVGKAMSTLSSFQASTSPTRENTDADKENVFTHEKLEWLNKEKLRDKHGRCMNDPDYDPRTLHVPSSFVNSKQVTPVGKFYELYHMDAVIAVKELGLVYMKGKFAHAGFPEIAYGRYADMLVQKGYKVARVEQTETPQMMNNRTCGKGEKVVRRELCAITTKATKMFRFNEGDVADDSAAYLLSVKESGFDETCGGESKYGVCFIDTSIGKFHIGQFSDDRQCSRLRTLIASYAPAQILFESNNLTKKTQCLLQREMAATMKDQLCPGNEFWEATRTIKYLQESDYFGDGGSQKWPNALKEMAEGGCDGAGLIPAEEYELALSALGACIWYLKKCLIDHELLSMKNFELYKPLDEIAIHKSSSSFTAGRNHMMLDGVTLTNLDVVPNGQDVPVEETLLGQVDYCCTPFGKRLFKQWLCSPLCNPKSVEERLDAVDDLMSQSSVVSTACEVLRGLPDLERLLRKIHSMGSLNRSTDHPDSRAIFYNEVTYSKKKISDFLAILEGFQNARRLCSLFHQHMGSFKSRLLEMTVGMDSSEYGGRFPDYEDELDFFKNAFNHAKAKEDGVILPKPGVDPDYDRAVQDIHSAKTHLNEYLRQQKKSLACEAICYWGTGRNRYQLEVPDCALARHTPSEYELQSSKKGFKRYWTPEIVRLNEQLTDAEGRRDGSLKDTMRKVFHQFDQKYHIWQRAVQSVAVLDCLISLTIYSSQTEGIMCRPEVLPIGDGEEDNSLSDGSCVVVTGPNMGGKSTLMRQVGLIVILAQLGCYVPAQKCRLTPVDRVFTRLGAHDRILSGESTFFVELSETACILRHSTKHSLVLLDELGRGTATYDGTAIASAVIRELAQEIQCRTLFSTHYHSLVEDFSDNPRVQLGHMACMEENDDEEGDFTKETITFLYKFVEGTCPKSYGFNAARLANIPEEVIGVAINKAKQFEENLERIKFFRLLACEKNNIKKLILSAGNKAL